MRTFLAFVQLLNFLIMIFATVYVLYSSWGNLETWRLALYSYYVILGFSGVTIAYWIAVDGKRLKNYAAKIEVLEKKLQELAQKIKNIKLYTPEKK